MFTNDPIFHVQSFYCAVYCGNGIVMKKNDERIEKYCKYCERAKTLSDPDIMLCEGHGVVSAGHVCRRFRYDPLKRAPRRPTLQSAALPEIPEI